jgi:hypothetical protein
VKFRRLALRLQLTRAADKPCGGVRASCEAFEFNERQLRALLAERVEAYAASVFDFFITMCTITSLVLESTHLGSRSTAVNVFLKLLAYLTTWRCDGRNVLHTSGRLPWSRTDKPLELRKRARQSGRSGPFARAVHLQRERQSLQQQGADRRASGNIARGNQILTSSAKLFKIRTSLAVEPHYGRFGDRGELRRSCLCRGE